MRRRMGARRLRRSDVVGLMWWDAPPDDACDSPSPLTWCARSLTGSSVACGPACSWERCADVDPTVSPSTALGVRPGLAVAALEEGHALSTT